jgi:catechol 2,3-dioxygenase-like lactoylglutathione lyase family enzyme
MNNKPPFLIQGAHHIAIQTRSWDQSLKLYQDVLGMPIVAWVPTQRKIALLDMGNGCYIELFEPADDTPQPGEAAANDPLMHIAIRVDEVEKAINHVRAAGYEVTVEPKTFETENFHTTIAFFRGPNGESIEFLTWHGAVGAI